ncbi:hypothetical protein SLEP1_g32741 [Rubroshorea leprosula]|uniref:Uncharacterized protein n=1 Tax=Rubroshorea leprosula TaxID=152421 RepID=A0AAV5KEH5_9ROSI|nr:hypothetical protein SLEP1_g32741 [Rubroshorea leprosula]
MLMESATPARPLQRLHFLTHASPDAECPRGICKKHLALQILEESGKDLDFWHEVDVDGVGHARPLQRLHFLTHASPDAECPRGICKKHLALQILEESGKDLDFPVPVTGFPYLS